MLGPMFALLLLTSPAAGPVDQSNCWLLCPSPTTDSGSSMGSRWAEEQRRNEVEDRLRRVENYQRQQEWERTVTPPSLGPSTSSVDCSRNRSIGAIC